MKVSLITVTYNNRETILETIKSVSSQSYANLEYIILDGGSEDGTKELLEKYDNHQVSVWVSEPDEGMYDAMNKGLQIASGDLIGFIHADDFYTSAHVIENVVKKIEEEQTDACYADLQYVDRDDPDVVVRDWKSGVYREGGFLKGWMPPHPTFFVRKGIYECYGGFHPSLGTAADYELMLRFIHKQKISLSYLPETIIKMRTGGLSNLSILNRLKANINDRKAWRINDLKPKVYTFFLKPFRKLHQFI